MTTPYPREKEIQMGKKNTVTNPRDIEERELSVLPPLHEPEETDVILSVSMSRETAEFIGVDPDAIYEADLADPEVEAAAAELGGAEPTFPDEGEHDPNDHRDDRDDIEEPFVDYEPAPLPDVAQILIIGSAEWESAEIIAAVLGPWFEHHTDRIVVAATSGCPEGAEALATSYVQYRGGQVTAIRDEQIVPGMFVQAFAFIRDGSEGASRSLDAAHAAGIPIRVTRVDDVKRISPWGNR